MSDRKPKYLPLFEWLSKQEKVSFEIAFADLEKVIELPKSAKTYPTYWSTGNPLGQTREYGWRGHLKRSFSSVRFEWIGLTATRQEAPTNEPWTKNELRASIEAYVEMLALNRCGEPYVKKDYYRDLSKRFGRTEKAYEYRAQNISYVLELLGRAWLPGLVPARNVGVNIIGQIESLLAESEGKHNSGEATLEAKVRSARRKHKRKRPQGQSRPKPEGKSQPTPKSTPTTSYERDHEVKAWVLDEAAGICECCGKEAPFIKHDGELFLEVHHVRRLADEGPDCVENAVAVCPNCHRALHYSREREVMSDELYERVARLVRE